MGTVPKLLGLMLSAVISGGALAANPAAPAPAAQVSKLDTDRAQVLAWTSELETAPLAGDAESKRAWLMQWVKEVRGLKVHVCDVFGAYAVKDSRVGSIVLKQYMFGSASYLIQHPTMDGKQVAVQMAGVTSAVNAYAALRKADPMHRNVHFDELVALQGKGELYDYVESNVFSKCSK